MEALGDEQRAAFEQKLMREARRFDLRPLIDLLCANGYERDDILFEAAREGSTSPSVVEALRFQEPPLRGVTITLNLGLFGDGTLLPSYFLEVIESSHDPEQFYDFVRFFDHRLAESYLRAVYPEGPGGPFGDFERALRSYFRMLGPGSTSTLQWLWQIVCPDLRVRVTRRTFASETGSHAFRTGESRLDGTGIIGKIYPWDASGFVVDIIVDEETDEKGRPWPNLLRERIAAQLFPLLDPFRISLLIRLVVLHHARWAKVDGSDPKEQGYLGFDRLRDKAPGSHVLILYRGVTGESAAR